MEREPASGLDHGKDATGAGEVSLLLDGTVENDAVLGRHDAPVTLTEYVDLQSPASAEYATKIFPALVERYVRTGQLRVQRRVVAIVDGSDVAAAWAVAAAGQGGLFAFSETFFRNQRHDDDEYLTPAFLDAVATAAGLPRERVRALAGGYRTRARLAADARAFKREGAEATPTLSLRRTERGAAGRVTELSFEGLSRRIESLGGQP